MTEPLKKTKSVVGIFGEVETMLSIQLNLAEELKAPPLSVSLNTQGKRTERKERSENTIGN